MESACLEGPHAVPMQCPCSAGQHKAVPRPQRQCCNIICLCLVQACSFSYSVIPDCAQVPPGSFCPADVVVVSEMVSALFALHTGYTGGIKRANAADWHNILIVRFISIRAEELVIAASIPPHLHAHVRAQRLTYSPSTVHRRAEEFAIAASIPFRATERSRSRSTPTLLQVSNAMHFFCLLNLLAIISATVLAGE